MKVYDFLCDGDRRTKEYKLIDAKMEEFRKNYGEMVNGKIRLDTESKNPEVFNFCNMELSEAICLLNRQ
jgi:hypothetical protein